MSRENVERLRPVYAEWARGNFRAGAELLADDVVFAPMSDGHGAHIGREAVKRQMREFLAQWSEFRIEAQGYAELGDAVVVTERHFGKGRSSGIDTEGTLYATWTFRDGLVVRIRWEADLATALEAAGEAGHAGRGRPSARSRLA
jgi:ketosteroid isomerase-like protein